MDGQQKVKILKQMVIPIVRAIFAVVVIIALIIMPKGSEVNVVSIALVGWVIVLMDSGFLALTKALDERRKQLQTELDALRSER